MVGRWSSPAHWRWAFALCLLVVLALALMPPRPYMPTTGWDKANHVLAFVALAVLGRLSYLGRTAVVLLGLLAYGGLIEALQALTPYRTADLRDLLADGIGLLLGWQVMRLLQCVARAQ